MKRVVYSAWFALVAVVLLTGCQPDASPEAKKAFESVIPKPTTATLAKGRFELTAKTQLVVPAESAEAKAVADYFAALIQPATGFNLTVSEAAAAGAGNVIAFELNESTLGAEGYAIAISADSVRIRAASASGLFYAVQTLRQLLPDKIELASAQPGPWELASGIIRDQPTYGWRGSMLDVARHFFGVDDVKRYIDLLALYKFNKLHLHLSDDQGWRIEIKSWPNLATHGGSTQVGGGPGGYYTQEQYKEIVAYAQQRFITIIPEIDMPSHTNAILASYGELNGGITKVPKEGRIELADGKESGKGRPTQLYTGIEVGFSTLQTNMPATTKFAEEMLAEIAALTPGPYLHIGGDEAAVTPHEEYIKMTNQFIEIVRKLGKTSIGWEETAQADIKGEHLVQYWTRAEFAKLGKEKGAKLIMSPSKRVYLDMQYDSNTRIGLNWAAYIEVDDAYNWDPATVEPGITAADIVGVEAPLWSETIVNRADIEYLLFPRITAIAEVAWTPTAARNLDDYKTRLARQEGRLKNLNINYYPSPQVPWGKGL
jgi:hexosaminidase